MQFVAGTKETNQHCQSSTFSVSRRFYTSEKRNTILSYCGSVIKSCDHFIRILVIKSVWRRCCNKQSWGMIPNHHQRGTCRWFNRIWATASFSWPTILWTVAGHASALLFFYLIYLIISAAFNLGLLQSARHKTGFLSESQKRKSIQPDLPFYLFLESCLLTFRGNIKVTSRTVFYSLNSRVRCGLYEQQPGCNPDEKRNVGQRAPYGSSGGSHCSP